MALSGKTVGSAEFAITGVGFDKLRGEMKKLSKDISSQTEEFKKASKEMKRAEAQMRGYAETISRADRLQKSFFERYKRGFARGRDLSAARNENGFYQLANAIGVGATALNKIESEAIKTFKAFQGLQRTGASLQATFGTIAGTIGDLAGTFMSLVGVAGAAAGSLYAIAGAMGTFIAAGITAKFALGGVGQAVSQLWKGQTQYNKALRDSQKQFRDLKFQAEELALSEQDAAIQLEKARETLARVQDLPPDNRTRREAELAYQQAELNYRKIKAQVQDNQDAIKRGSKDLMGATADPMKNLTDSQKSFVRYLLTLKPAIRKLKEAASDSFLPPLQTGIDTLVTKLFPRLQQGLAVMGKDMGTAFQTIADGLTTTKNLDNVNNFFVDAGKNIKVFGAAISAGLGAFLSLMHAAQPITERFGKALTKYFGHLDDYFSTQSFRDFLQLAGDVASKLGEVFGSVFDGISNIIHAAFPSGAKSGAGGVLLDWLQKITDGFKAFTGSTKFADWLKSATENGTTALSTIGKFLKIFLELAADPATKQFWEILAQAVTPVKDMLAAGQAAGPSFAKLIVSLAKLLAVFATDSGILTSFFDVLTMITDAMTAILTPIKPVLDFLGRIHGVFLAVGLAIKVGAWYFKMLSGLFETIMIQLGGLFKGIGNFNKSIGIATKESTVLGKALRKTGYALKEVWWGFKSGFAAQNAFIKSMYQSSPTIKKISAGLSATGKALKSMATSAREAGTKLRTSLTNISGKAMDAFRTRTVMAFDAVERGSTRFNKFFEDAAKKVRVRSLLMADAVERTSDRIVRAFQRSNKAQGAVPKDSRRARNRAQMAAMGAIQNMGGISDADRMAPLAATERATAATRVTIRQRLMATLDKLEAKSIAFQRRTMIQARARNAAIYAAGYKDSMGWIAKQRIGMQVFRKSQLAADIQHYARRAKFNIINPTWLTGPIKTAASATKKFSVTFFREAKYRGYIAKEEAKEYLKAAGSKLAADAQHYARRAKFNIINPTWWINEVKGYVSGVTQKIKANDLFDVKRRASVREQIKYARINAVESFKQTKAYSAMGNVAASAGRRAVSGFKAIARAASAINPLTQIRNAAATLRTTPTVRPLPTEDFAAIRANRASRVSAVVNPTGAVPKPPAPGMVLTANDSAAAALRRSNELTKAAMAESRQIVATNMQRRISGDVTRAYQKLKEANYSRWWINQETLKNRVKRALDRRGMFEEGKTLRQRLGNVINSYRIEREFVSKARKTRWAEGRALLAAEVRQTISSVKNKIAKEGQWFLYRSRHNGLSFGRSLVQYGKDAAALGVAARDKIAKEGQWFLYRSKHNIRSLKENLVQYRKDAIALGVAAKNKIAKEGQWFLYRSKHNIRSFRENVANYRKDFVESVKNGAKKMQADFRQNRAVLKARIKNELELIAYRAKANIMNPTWLTSPAKALGSAAARPFQNMWGRIKNASLDAAKQSRYSWAASNGATAAQLKKLETQLRKVKSMAELTSNKVVQGMTPGYGGFKGTMGRLSGKYGAGAMGVGMAASMMGPQPEQQSGLTQGLGAAGMAAMMIPGGQLAGAGLMIAGAISAGFDKAAEDEKKRLEKIREIRIAKATVINESVEQAKTGVAALVGQGVEVGTATRRYNAQLDKAKELSGVDTMVKGADESKEDFEARKKTASESASRAVDLFTESGLFKGDKGSNKAIGMMDRFKSLTEPGNALFGNNPEALAEQLIKIQREGFKGEDGKMLKGEKAFDAFYKASGAENKNAGFVGERGGDGRVVYETQVGGSLKEAENKILGLFNEESIVNKGVHKDSMFATQASFSKYATSTLKKEGIATPSVVLSTAGGMGKDTDYIDNQVAPAYKAARDKIINELNAKADLPENMRYAYDKNSGKIVIETLKGQEVEKKKRDLESQAIYQGIWDSTKEMVAAYREKKAEGITLKIVDAMGKPVDINAVANG